MDRGRSGVVELQRKKEIIKGKTPSKGTREGKIKDGSPNKIHHSKVQNTQCKAPKTRNQVT